MTIQGRTGWLVVGIPMLLLATVVIFTASGWFQEHDARLKVQIETGAQQRQIDNLRQQQATTQAALDARVASIERERSRPVTAVEFVKDAPTAMPGLPEPLRTQEISANVALPDGPKTEAVVIPEADLRGIRDAQLTCEENTAKLASCQTLQTDSQQQLKLTEAQRDEWKTTAKGGSMWHRALGAAKWFAVGAGTGAAAYAIAHHK